MEKLVIERDRWLRGEGSANSRLLRSSDQKMCCLGFYLKSKGISDEKLEDLTTPSEVKATVPEWLCGSYKNTRIPSGACNYLILTNDGQMNEIVREKNIAQKFLEHDVEVEFV